ncbi:MAG: DUF512 domain-containing protein [Coriobacteriales bacterium]|jgi:NifB/MoaA-like Fe-S oxidoreductase|nr:DUF512 domain-containing protein [Coriobacteriales bacterium]
MKINATAEVTTGAQIASVAPGSPAARAGLEAGMVLVRVNKEPLRDIIDWLWLTSDEKVLLEIVHISSEAKTLHAAPALLLASTDAGVAPALAAATSTGSAATSTYTLTRNLGETWGIEFADPLFDGIMRCVNACVFCFMTMLPEGMRAPLYVRDDDYRLSFLQGNFVTLTNMSADDLQRVIDYRLSPLHVSLHAVTPEVRTRLMGSNHARGIEVLERLLAAGIEAHAQIVLVPGYNDGAELDATLSWVEARPGILSVGIVPYGYTRFAALQGAYTAEQARAIVKQAMAYGRVQVSDEFFLLSGLPLPPAAWYGDYPQYEDGIGMLRSYADEWGEDSRALAEGCCESQTLAEGREPCAQAAGCGSPVLAYAPVEETSTCGTRSPAESSDSPRLRSSLRQEQLEECSHTPQPAHRAHAPQPAFETRNTPQPAHAQPLGGGGEEGFCALQLMRQLVVTGEAFAPMLRELVRALPDGDCIEVIAIKNRFFGGNVDVAGLLTAADIIAQLAVYFGGGLSAANALQLLNQPPDKVPSKDTTQVILPAVIFNDDGLTLDGQTVQDIAQALERQVTVVDCTAEGLLDALYPKTKEIHS